MSAGELSVAFSSLGLLLTLLALWFVRRGPSRRDLRTAYLRGQASVFDELVDLLKANRERLDDEPAAMHEILADWLQDMRDEREEPQHG